MHPVFRSFVLCTSLMSVSACADESREFRLLPTQHLALVTFAGDILIARGPVGEADHSRAAQLSQILTRALLDRVVGEQTFGYHFRVRPSTDTRPVSASDIVRLYDEDGSQKLFVNASSQLRMIRPTSSLELSHAASELEVPFTVWVVNQYEWRTGIGFSWLPFVREKWTFVIHTKMKVVDRQGRVVFASAFESHAANAQSGLGRDFVLYSSSKLPDDRAARLVDEALSAATSNILRTVEQLYGEN